MVRGSRVITLAIGGVDVEPFSSARRRSPSVKMPITRCLRSTHRGHAHAAARHLEHGVRQAMRRVGEHAAHRLPVRITSRTWVSSLPAERAARMRAREIVAAEAALHQRHGERVAERERRGGARGRREVERTGFLRRAGIRCTSASRARLESGLPVIAISLAPRRLISGTIASSSSLSPEYESAMKTSSRVTMPRSPWLASAGCTK